MTTADEALARDEAAVTLARGTIAQTGEIGALTGTVAEWADWALAGGAPARWVANQMITANLAIAAAARGQAATL